MVNAMQFKASLKKEWLEILRTKKLFAYLLLSFGFLIVNLIFQSVFQMYVINSQSVSYAIANWYTSQTSFNTYLLGINLIVVLFVNRNVVTKELSEKKLAVPLALGLKSSINITSKMAVQILVPSIIAMLASMTNACLSALILDNVAVGIVNVGMVSINFLNMIVSALCVLVTMVILMMFLVSLQALVRNPNISLILSLTVLIAGDNVVNLLGVSAFTPVAFYSYALNIINTSTASEMILSSIITISIVILMAVAGVLVYTDRNDFAL